MDHLNVAGPLAVGDVVNLTCTATGEPLPSIQWYREDTLLMNQSSITIYNSEHNNLTASVLELRGLAVGDSGNYSCQADNIVGNSSIEFEVMVMSGMI